MNFHRLPLLLALPLPLLTASPSPSPPPAAPAASESQPGSSPATATPVPVTKPKPWLGLKLSKPDASTTAQLPSLPAGMGFVVRNVEPNGPAEHAGIQPNDILWKLGDQWLANESQLATLLRLSAPGELLTFSGFRAGKPCDFKLTLGKAPHHVRGIPADLLESAVLPNDCGGPWRVINVAEKMASFSSPEGSVQLRKHADTYSVKITNPNHQVIYDGPLPAESGNPPYPEPWPRRIQALRRGLDHALALRQPRPRVIVPSQSPSPKQTPEDSVAPTAATPLPPDW